MVYYLWTIILGNLLGYFNYKKLTVPFKRLTIFMSCVLCSEFFANLMYDSGNNRVVYHILIPCQIIFYSLIFSSFRKNKVVFIIIAAILVLFSIFNAVYIQTILDFPTYPLMLLSIALTMATLFDFKRILESPSNMNIIKLPEFWMNIGTLFFFSTTFFIFSFDNLYTYMKPKYISGFIIIVNVIMYGSYALSIYLDSRLKRVV